jgi:hypothetical protein
VQIVDGTGKVYENDVLAAQGSRLYVGRYDMAAGKYSLAIFDLPGGRAPQLVASLPLPDTPQALAFDADTSTLAIGLPTAVLVLRDLPPPLRN